MRFFVLISICLVLSVTLSCAKRRPKSDPIVKPTSIILDGTQDINSAYPLNLSVEMTALCWIKATSGKDFYNQIIGQKEGELYKHFNMSFDIAEYKNTGKLHSNIYSADGSWPPEKWYYSKEVVFDGSWRMVGMSYAPNDLRLIVDKNYAEVEGKIYDQKTLGIYPSTATLQLGKVPNSDKYSFEGSMSQCSIWRKALSLSEIEEAFNIGRAGDLLKHSSAKALSNYWPLDSLPVLHDKVGGNDFTSRADGVSLE